MMPADTCVQQGLAARAQAMPLTPVGNALLGPCVQEPARGKGGPAGMFAGAAALLQLRLLEAYAALPSPAAYTDEQEALTKLCMRTVRCAMCISRASVKSWRPIGVAYDRGQTDTPIEKG